MPEPPSADDQSREVSHEELDVTKQQLSTYRELIEEVPALYERKFRERLQPILERNQQLIEEGRLLDQQVTSALPPGGDAPVHGALPPTRDRQPEPPNARRSGKWWFVFGSLAALLLLGGGLLLRTIRQPRPVQPPGVASPPPKPRPVAPTAKVQRATPAPGELLLKTSGISWLEVRTLSGSTLFLGTLQGTRTFPLGQGLRISAGRPDLVTVQAHGEAAKILGGIREIGWHAFPPKPRPTP